MPRVLDGDRPGVEEVRKKMHGFIKVHNQVSKVHNSPMRPGEAEHMEWARVKYLERGAGAIQVYQWLFNGGPEPDFLSGMPIKLD